MQIMRTNRRQILQGYREIGYAVQRSVKLQRSFHFTPKADLIVVEKSAYRMRLFSHGQELQSFRVALGRGSSGNKVREGDNKVPEGTYRIAGRNPHSTFHLSLRIGYPTPEQARMAQARGINPGGDVMIHGIRRGLGWIGPLHRYLDWTRGCIAVTDNEMDEIWRWMPDGTVIVIEP